MQRIFVLWIAIVVLLLAGCDNNAPGNPAGSTQKASAAASPEAAFAELLNQAKAGDASAQYAVGKAYRDGKGVAKDFARAVAWYSKAAEQGDTTAQFSLGEMYDNGEGVAKDTAKALEWYTKAAEQGDAGAQYILGLMYYNGAGVDKDFAKALEWYGKAAKQGDAYAQFWLGNMYQMGDEVTRDAIKAAEWYRKAAEQGHAYAQTNLGVMYDNGEGVAKDAAKAIEWYSKAAEQGDAYAQNSLGVMYANGDGVAKDAAKAVAWYRKAAEQGDANAQNSLGWMYDNGEGVAKDAAKAVEWYTKAAEQGDAAAQFNLGMMYYAGNGVPRDLVRAYVWFNLAAAQGRDGAKHNRDVVEGKLTPAQRAEGQRLASGWKPGDSLASADAAPTERPPTTRAPTKQSTGTAFMVSANGQALTNQHVVEGCTLLKVAGRDGLTKLITADGVNDMALLQLPAGDVGAFAPFNADPAKLRQGEDVVVFGYPLHSLLSSGGNLTPGVLSALSGLGNNTNQIQITAPLQPGSSGSPVLDRKGDVIGMVSMKLDDGKTAAATGSVPQNVGFAVNGQTLKAFLDANRVPYQTGGGWFARDKSNVDIADAARQWTMIVECWK
jgi:hypothetical protein